MSIWLISGCEPGLNSYAIVGSNGTFSADTTIKRTGAYSYKLPAVAGLGGNFKLAGWSTSTGLPANLTSGGEIYITYYVYRTAQTTSGKKHIALDGNAGDNACYTWLNTDGTLSVYDANGVSQGTTSTSIPLNTWARIELRVLMGTGANGTCTLRIYQDDADGSSPSTLSLTGKDFQAGASTYFKLVQFSAQETTGDIYYDDIVIADDAFYPGKVALMIPSADGTDTGFESYVGSADYTSLDDVPGSVSDALRSPSATAAAETPAMESCASAGISGTINAVLCLCYADADSTAINVKLRYRSGGVVDSADFSVSTTEGYKGVLSTTKPAGGAWDTTALDALEVGLVDNDATRRVIFGAAHAEVHFTEAAAGGGSILATMLQHGLFVGAHA